MQDIDYYTTCQTFRECLGLVRGWSEAHPLHAPLMIHVEAKDDVLPNNTVKSEKVAEKWIVRRSAGHGRDGIRRGWLGRMLDQFQLF